MAGKGKEDCSGLIDYEEYEYLELTRRRATSKFHLGSTE